MAKNSLSSLFRISFRVLLWLVIWAFGLIVMLPIVALMLFDPNDFKPQIHHFFAEKLHLPVTINGQIALTFFPQVGITAHDLSFANPPGYPKIKMIEIKKIHFKIPVKQLLQKKAHFNFQQLTMDEAKLIFQDKFYSVELSHVKLSATLDSSFASLDSLDSAHQPYFTQSTFDYKINAPTFPVSMHGSGTMSGHLKQGLSPLSELNELNTQLSFQSDDPYFKQGQLNTFITTDFATQIAFNRIKLISEKVTFTGAGSIHLQNLLESHIKGEWEGTNIAIENTLFNKITASLTTEGNHFIFDPIHADFYQGKLKGKITYAMIPPHALTFEGKGTDIPVDALLKSLQQKPLLQGIASLDFNLAKTSQTPLHGLLHFDIQNGAIEGIDLNYTFDVAQSFITQMQQDKPKDLKDNPKIDRKSNQKRTPFTSLSGNLKLHDNVLDNNDLLLQSPSLTAKGEGSVFLTSQTLEYKLQAWCILNGILQQDFPLALRIKGPLRHPHIEPQLDLYLKTYFKKTLQRQLHDITSSKENDQTQSDKTQEDLIKEKVSKEIERGLKKLFKKH